MSNTALVNNVYYDMNVYNATSTPIQAQINNKLLFPLLNQSDSFSVSLAKAKVPLNSIPLTRSNIPLKQLQVGFKIGTTEETAYVRQVNASQFNFVWNCPKGSTIITKYQYALNGALTYISEQDLSLVVPNVYNFVIDDYQNIFVIGSDSTSEVYDTLYVIDENNNLLYTQTYTFLKHIYIDRGQNLYLCDDAPTPKVYIYGMNNSIGSVSLTENATITTNNAGNPLTNLLFCVADNEIIVGYNSNTITLYNSQYEPQTDIVEASITQLQNLANIDVNANTYILSDGNEIDDTLYGTTSGGLIYDVNTDTQATNGTIISSLAITPSYAFAIGANNFTYATAYPFVNPPVSWNQVNGINGVKAIYAYQKLGLLFACGTSNQYNGWNFNCGPNPSSVPNSWSELGEFEISESGQIYPTSIDVQATTNKLVASGTGGGLYITQYPTYPYEIIFMNGVDATQQNQIYGIQGNQTSNLSRNFSLSSGDFEGIFKQGSRFWCSQINNSLADLIIYDLNFNVLETNTGFETNMLYLTYFKTGGKFAYLNNAPNVVVRSITGSYAIEQTYPLPDQATEIQALCELDATHFAMLVNSSVYVYDYVSTTPITVISVPNDGYDITANQSDVQNGASTLFMLANNSSSDPAIIQCNQIYKCTFANSTYILANTPTLVYTETRPNLSISYLEAHNKCSAVGFLTANQTQQNPTNVSLNYLYSLGSYSSSNLFSAPIPISPQQTYQLTKAYGAYLLQSVSATALWTQLTTNINVSSVSVSRSSPNRIYAINSSNNLIYRGTINGTLCPLVQLIEFTQTYNQIASTPNNNPNISSTLYLYGLQSQNLISSTIVGDEVGEIARNEVDFKYIVSLRNNQQIRAFNPTTLASLWTSSLTGAYRLFSKNGSDIDAGNVNIYDMAVLIASINSALSEAATKINQSTASGVLQTPPVLSLDYQTGLCSLSYPPVLTQSGNGILFNQQLLNYVYFLSTTDQQSGLQQLTLNTQAEVITQNVKSIYNFNQLDKILFRSNTIFVVGAYFGINSSNNIFFDVDVPTSDFIENLDQVLYFQPNFLRTYFLKSNLPLDNIQLQLYYQYRDGTDYELYLNQGQNTTVKLQFVAKF